MAGSSITSFIESISSEANTMIYPSNRIANKRKTKPWYHVVVRDYQDDEVIRVCSYQSRSKATKRASFFCNKDTFATVCVHNDPWDNCVGALITVDDFAKQSIFSKRVFVKKCKPIKNNRNKYKIVSPHFEKPCFWLG